MDKLKEILQNKKLIFTISGVLIGIIILVLVVFLVIKMMGKEISYSELENELYFATEKYLKDNDTYYPNELIPEVTLTSSELVNGKYIKDLNKLVDDNCSAEISITYQNDSYNIRPFLTCNNYESSTFFDKITEDNPIISDGNGLYNLNEMLVFRGGKVNNYVNFNNMLWRIVKMDPDDSSIFLILEDIKSSENAIWDNSYNTSEESKHGINDFSVSTVSYTLSDSFETKFNNVKSKMLPMDICIGKRSETETINDGSVECSNIFSQKLLLSLLPIYDYINSSTDRNCNKVQDRACSNYNYLVNKNGKWWTITADGAKGTRVYGISATGVIDSFDADSKRYLRYVIKINGANLYQEGDGTLESPYKMK